MVGNLPENILIVDDDFVFRELAEAVFSGMKGTTVKLAENGAKAIGVLKSFKPDLILLDISMPEMDGVQFLKDFQVMDGLNGTPVIFITQFQNINVTGQQNELGVIGVLHKPIKPYSLVQDVQNIWATR